MRQSKLNNERLNQLKWRAGYSACLRFSLDYGKREVIPRVKPSDNTPGIVLAVGHTPRSNDCMNRSLLPDIGDETIFYVCHISRIAGQFRAQRAFFEHGPPRQQDQENQS